MRFSLKVAAGFLCMTLLSAVLSGCSFTANIDALLVPPRLTKEQEQINKALSKSVGENNYKLKYPKAGEHRSPFLIENIDEEPTDEAIVFYQRTGGSESVLRMKILDQENGEWVPVYDHACGGTEVDKVLISKLGEGAKTTILAGYTQMNQGERLLEAYTYENGTVGELYSGSYSDVEVLDIDKDSYNELVIITTGMTNLSFSNLAANAVNTERTAVQSATAICLVRKENTFVVAGEVKMDERAVDFTSIFCGNVGTDTPALYVDSKAGEGKIQTQILYCENDALVNPLEQRRDILQSTLRPLGYASTDIDNDKIAEIPVLSVFPGYETLPAEEQFYATDWYVFEQYALTKKYTSYYSINDGYCFMLPSRWQGTVTAKEDIAADEVVFYRYDGVLSEDMTELMRISVMKRGTNSDKLADGYMKILSKGQLDYLVKVADAPHEPLVLTKSEIVHNFYLTRYF